MNRSFARIVVVFTALRLLKHFRPVSEVCLNTADQSGEGAEALQTTLGRMLGGSAGVISAALAPRPVWSGCSSIADQSGENAWGVGRCQ